MVRILAFTGILFAVLFGVSFASPTKSIELCKAANEEFKTWQRFKLLADLSKNENTGSNGPATLMAAEIAKAKFEIAEKRALDAYYAQINEYTVNLEKLNTMSTKIRENFMIYGIMTTQDKENLGRVIKLIEKIQKSKLRMKEACDAIKKIEKPTETTLSSSSSSSSSFARKFKNALKWPSRQRDQSN